MKVLSIVDTINGQAFTLIKVVVVISHFKVQSLCKETIDIFRKY